VRQLDLVPQGALQQLDQSQQPRTPLPKLDDQTLREVVVLMAEAILAVVGQRMEGDDDR
jgi:hypothetical protein